MSHTGSESDQPKIEPYAGPAGGWGSVRSVEGILAQEGRLISGNLVLLKQNKPDGFACVSCAWAKPAEPHPVEVCCTLSTCSPARSHALERIRTPGAFASNERRRPMDKRAHIKPYRGAAAGWASLRALREISLHE